MDTQFADANAFINHLEQLFEGRKNPNRIGDSVERGSYVTDRGGRGRNGRTR